jgi:CubicO group peptidase (beta-lactamase class C family)
MNSATARWLLVPILLLVAAVGCSSSPASPPSPASLRTSAGAPPLDYGALEAEIEKAITTGPAALDNVRAVLVSVDGQTKIAHYRHGFTADDHGHVFSVTKSVISILIGIATADGLIAGIDQPLAELLPDHRQAMGGDVAKITLRQLMTMFGGFAEDLPESDHWEGSAKAGGDYVDLLVERLQYPGTTYWYSDVSAHLVAAVLAAALERADGDRPRTILDYAGEKLFDPLGISTRPAFSRPLLDVFAPGFAKAGFGWGTDPNGIHIGAFGLRLTAPDMIKIGELYRRDGVWNGQQIVPADWIHQSTSPSEHNEEYGLLWWIIGEPDGPGYAASGRGEQSIIVLPKSRAVIVYLANVQPDREINETAIEPLDNVFVTAFP